MTGGAFTLRSVSARQVSRMGRWREHHHFKCQEEATRQREHTLSVLKTVHPETFKVIKEFTDVPHDFHNLLSICRKSRQPDGFALKTFSYSKPGLRCTQGAMLAWESESPHGYAQVGHCWRMCWHSTSRGSHSFTLNNILRKFFGLQVMYVHRFYFRWIPSEWNSSDARSRFVFLSVSVQDSPTTSQTCSALHEAQTIHDTRNKLNTLQRLVLCALRLLQHHEENALRRRQVLRSVRKSTGVPQVRSKLQSGISGQKTSTPRGLDTMPNEMQRHGASAEMGSDTDRSESDRHAQGKKPRQRQRLRVLVVLVDHLVSGANGSIILLDRRALRTKAAIQQYRDVKSRFMTLCLESGLLLITQEQIGSGAVTYSNSLFIEGVQHHVWSTHSGYSPTPAHGTSSQRVASLAESHHDAGQRKAILARTGLRTQRQKTRGFSVWKRVKRCIHKRSPCQFMVEMAASRSSVRTAVNRGGLCSYCISDSCLTPIASRLP